MEETGKAPVSLEVEIVPPSLTTIPEGVNDETPNGNENAPSEELGATTTGHSLSLPTFSEGAIEEANTLRMSDPNKDVAKFRAELSQCEAERKKVSGEEKALRLLCIQKEEELKDLRTALVKAQKSESELAEQVTSILTEYGLLGPALEAKTLISQLQQKLDMIGQLRGKVDQVRADCHQWKKNMDPLAADKEVVAAQLASAEAHFLGIAKGLAQARKIERLEVELAKAWAKAAQAKGEVVQAKAEAEKTKVVANKSIAIYSREATVIQVKLREASDRGRWSNELATYQARRETLEEIHARGL
ncbi:uncharacterized protein [Nicotiana sylvestris]|uniref:uncharacterized protein n=1 Tax=Nicotiana sylvestris TaxID=4096 RepID=UPI00388C624F